MPISSNPVTNGGGGIPSFVISTPYSCSPAQPLMTFGGGNAPVINYNLPSTTTFEVKGGFPLYIPVEKFKEFTRQKRDLGIWARAKSLSYYEILNEVFDIFRGGRGKHGLFLNQNLLKGIVIPFEAPELQPPGKPHKEMIGNFNSAPTEPYEPYKAARPVKMVAVNGSPLSQQWSNPYQLATYISEGLIPVVHRNFAGQIDLDYLREPKNPVPQLMMVEVYKVANFLGDYGASKTVGTFSLLPGEETDVTVESYTEIETTKTKSENVLDSFTENSSKALEHSLQQESGTRVGEENGNTDSLLSGANSNTNTGYSSGGTTNSEHSSNWNMGGGLTIGFPGFPIGGNISGGGGGSNSGGSSTSFNNLGSTTSGVMTEAGHTNTFNSMREQLNNQLQNAVDRTVSESSAHRQVEINTTSTESYREEHRNVTVRRLKNINYSRTLNFVFRQLTQQYLSITYLHDVFFVYSNGYPDSRIEVKLDNLEQLLLEVLVDKTASDKVLGDIMMDLCSVADYQGTKRQFAKCDTIELINCCNGNSEDPNSTLTQHYLHKNPALEMEVSGIKVKGVVIDVKERILPVKHVIVEALLGQGEALDCYNSRLQNASAVEAEQENERVWLQNQQALLELQNQQAEITLAQRAQELENLKIEQAMAILDAITDPTQKAEFYKKVFGTCCDTPQTQVIS